MSFKWCDKCRWWRYCDCYFSSWWCDDDDGDDVGPHDNSHNNRLSSTVFLPIPWSVLPLSYRPADVTFWFSVLDLTFNPINWPNWSRQTLPSMLMFRRQFSSRRSLLDIAPRNLFANNLTGIHGFVCHILLKLSPWRPVKKKSVVF